MLTAQDVLERRFAAAGLFRAGYSADDVDDWLDGVATTLRAYEGEEGGRIELLAEDAREVVFRTTRGATAYSIEQVDRAVEEVAASLAAHEAES